MNSKTAFRLGEVLKIPSPNLMDDCDSRIRTHNHTKHRTGPLCWMEDDRSLRATLLRQIPLAIDAPTIQSIDNVLSDTYHDDQEMMQVLKHAKESYPVGAVTANGRTSGQLTSLHTFGPPVLLGMP